MSLEFKSREVPIKTIQVPWDTLPGIDKIAQCYGFYRRYGFLDRVIVIDGQYWLRDGLAGLMVARAVGLKRVKVLQVTEKKDKSERTPVPKTERETDAALTAPAAPEGKPEGRMKTEEFLQALPDFQIPKEVEELTKLRVLCVESYKGLRLGQTRGKVYEFNEGMVYDGEACYRPNGKPPFTFGAWRRGNVSFARCVVPLVSRPAKVGEWVRAKRPSYLPGDVKEGDIGQVLALHKGAEAYPELYAGAVYVSSKQPAKYNYFANMDRPIPTGNFAFLSSRGMYDVLEGYDGRFEPTVEESVPPAQRIEVKTPCDCYHERESGPHGVTSECWGTREREECSAHGYKELCTFYPEHRKSPTIETGGSHETEV